MDIGDLKWVAGILEGEGAFVLTTRYDKPNIAILLSMMDDDVVQDVFDIVKVGTMSGPSEKGVYRWQVNKQADAAALMMTLYPLMKERRQTQIKRCLEAWRKIPYRHQRPCPNGHIMEGDNLYISKPGTRQCRICRNERSREYQAAIRREREESWH